MVRVTGSLMLVALAGIAVVMALGAVMRRLREGHAFRVGPEGVPLQLPTPSSDTPSLREWNTCFSRTENIAAVLE